MFNPIDPNLDEGEIDLICKYNALDLVLIEEANELFRKCMVDEFLGEEKTTLVEHVYTQMCGHYNKFCLPMTQFRVNNNDMKSVLKNNKNILKQYKEYIKDLQEDNLFGMIDFNLYDSTGELGGHFICFYKTKDEIILFNSMSDDDEKGDSLYLTGLKYILNEVFPETSEGRPKGSLREFPNVKKYNRLVNKDYYLQETGGFIDNIPRNLLLTSGIRKLKDIPRHIVIQSTESQNHFCYMWCLWFVNFICVHKGGNTFDYFNKKYMEITNDLLINNIDPLIVIKRYILNIINMYPIHFDSSFVEKYQEKYNITLSSEFTEFFNQHFPLVWKHRTDRIYEKLDVSKALEEEKGVRKSVRHKQSSETNFFELPLASNFEECFKNSECLNKSICKPPIVPSISKEVSKKLCNNLPVKMDM